ncbi:uncharacterized protein J5F26_004735 isoform 2-T2 [Ciconia maguari]
MRTTQNVLQWEQRPLQGSAPGSCSPVSAAGPAREGKRRPARCHRSLGRCWRHGRCRVAGPSVGKARPGAWARSRAPRRRAPWDAGGEDAPVRGASCRGGRAGLRGGTGALGSRGWLCRGGLRCCRRGRGPQGPGGGFVLGALWLCPSSCWGVAEGRSRTPSGLPAGPFGGKEGSRRRGAAPLWLPWGSAPQGQGLHLVGRVPRGQRLFVGAGGALGGPSVPVPAAPPGQGQAGLGCTFQGAAAARGVWSRCCRGPVPSPSPAWSRSVPLLRRAAPVRCGSSSRLGVSAPARGGLQFQLSSGCSSSSSPARRAASAPSPAHAC